MNIVKKKRKEKGIERNNNEILQNIKSTGM